ncbi:MAG TPA: heterodisulfide reductase-related iron-sulfur binding cluster [Nannocystaceae bacterium]|nr:heterodisulfide reductase-related iron-sulfur binding cluster [Nannocystaceae bacterium]
MAETNISYKPTDGLCYDPSDPKYWDEAGLQAEVTRVFEVCHGCRMCFKYCDSFPNLFELLDNKYDGDVRKLDAADTARVMDACFQCKLCDVQCPYTPRDNHEFQLDFPKLVHRWKALRAKREGLSLRDKVLGDPDATAKLARASLGLVNVMNRVQAHRWFMEKVVGIHRDKLLPSFARQSFTAWAKSAGKITRETGAEAILFQTCYVEHNEPQIGRDTLEVMEKNQVDLRCVDGLRCCGMPAWEHGDLEALRAQARQNLDVLMPHVDAGAKVMAVNPTCSMMLRREWPELLEGEDRERAKKLAAAVVDPSEHLWSIRREPRFNTEFKSTPGAPVAYHAPCHLRAQAIGFRARNLLGKIPGVESVGQVMECCGHDGTYAMTVEGFVPSQRVGKRAFDGMKAAETEVWATDCPLAAIQFEQHAGVRPMHPMTLLARAYREDGFATKVPPKEEP